MIDDYKERELIYLCRLGSKEAWDILLDIYSKRIDLYISMFVRFPDESLLDDFKQEALIYSINFTDIYREDKLASAKTYFFKRLHGVYRTFTRRNFNKKSYYGQTLSLSKNISEADSIENIIEDSRTEYKPDIQLNLKEEKRIRDEKVALVASKLELSVYRLRQEGYSYEEIAILLKTDIRVIYNANYRLQKKLAKLK